MLGALIPMHVLSSYTEVYSVIYESGSVRWDHLLSTWDLTNESLCTGIERGLDYCTQSLYCNVEGWNGKGWWSRVCMQLPETFLVPNLSPFTYQITMQLLSYSYHDDPCVVIRNRMQLLSLSSRRMASRKNELFRYRSEGSNHYTGVKPGADRYTKTSVSVYLSIYLSIYLSVYLYIHNYKYLYTYIYTYIYIYIYIYI